MKEFDIKSDMPSTSIAELRLKNYIKMMKPTEKIIKVIHGYGSHGTGGKIRVMVRETLADMIESNQIKAYIPGEATSTLMGFDSDIRLYKGLLQGDADFHKGNDGITYVIL